MRSYCGVYSRPSRLRYDLVLYFANATNCGNETVARVNWTLPMGLNAPKFPREVPTLFVSVANPYHLHSESRR